MTRVVITGRRMNGAERFTCLVRLNEPRRRGIAERRLRKGTTDDGQAKVGAPIIANRVLALVKKMFNFALDREWIPWVLLSYS